MTVRELIEQLQERDPDEVVILQKDAEGNGHSPLEDFSNCDTYLPESTRSGEVGFSALTPELVKEGYSKEDVICGGVPAVVLCPAN